MKPSTPTKPKRLYHVINSARRGVFIVAEGRREAQRIFLLAGRVTSVDNAWARDVTERYEAALPDLVPLLLQGDSGVVELPVITKGGVVRGELQVA